MNVFCLVVLRGCRSGDVTIYGYTDCNCGYQFGRTVQYDEHFGFGHTV